MYLLSVFQISYKPLTIHQGFSPTIMVARVAYSSGQEVDTTAITHISGLQFHGQSTSPNISQSSADAEYIETAVMEETKEKSEKEKPMMFIA